METNSGVEGTVATSGFLTPSPPPGIFFPEEEEAGRRETVQDNTERKSAGPGVEDKGEPPEGAEIWFDGVRQLGQVDDFVIAWADRGKVKHFLLAEGRTCLRNGGGNGAEDHLGWLFEVAGPTGGHTGLPLSGNGLAEDGYRTGAGGRPIGWVGSISHT